MMHSEMAVSASHQGLFSANVTFKVTSISSCYDEVGMGRRIGYARVSTDDQNLAIQKTALDRDGCAIVFEEKRSGTKRDGRAQLELAVKVLTKGDTLVVLRLDRLGRSLRDLANIAHELDESVNQKGLPEPRRPASTLAENPGLIATRC